MHTSPCSSQDASPRLPPEILEQVLRHNVPEETRRADVRAHENPRGWRVGAKSLATYSRVSKDWHDVASDLLYSRRIDIRDVRTATLLLRTAEELAVRRIACPIRWLSICNYPILRPDASRQEINAVITPLLARCTELHYLELRFVTLEMGPDPTESLPVFERLRELSVADMNVYDIAPIISKAPNLRCFDAFMLGNPLFPSSRAVLEPPRELLPPTYSLENATLADCELPLAHARWLLGSTRVAHLDIQDDRFGMRASLSRAAGPAVRSLRFGGVVPQKREAGLARALARFTHIEALRIDHLDCPWTEVLHAINAPLQLLELPGSVGAARTLCKALTDNAWLPTLSRVVLHRISGRRAEPLSVSEGRALEESCLTRGISCFIGRA